MLKSTILNKELRAKNVANGFCRCGRTRKEGRKNCQRCLDLANQRNATRAASGLCYCGQRPPTPGKKQCETCLSADRRAHQRNRDVLNRKLSERYYRLKSEAYECLGPVECVGCGISSTLVLSVDHIHGNGYNNRKINGSSEVNYGLYRKITKMSNPKSEFQLLCFNCQRMKNTNSQDWFLTNKQLIVWGPKDIEHGQTAS